MSHITEKYDSYYRHISAHPRAREAEVFSYMTYLVLLPHTSIKQKRLPREPWKPDMLVDFRLFHDKLSAVLDVDAFAQAVGR